MDKAIITTSIGALEIVASDKGIQEIHFLKNSQKRLSSKNPHILKAIKQLKQYFEGRRKAFDIHLDFEATDFQTRVYQRLMKIPFGKTKSYKDIATEIKNKNASRAVGGACNKNKLPIIIPCHRVIGKNGNLTGFASGISIKKKLLQFEQNHM